MPCAVAAVRDDLELDLGFGVALFLVAFFAVAIGNFFLIDLDKKLCLWLLRFSNSPCCYRYDIYRVAVKDVMETKFNDATNNRPFGERVIDAAAVMADLNRYCVQIMEEEAWQKNDRNAITLFKSDKVTVTLVALHADAAINFNHAEDTDIVSVQCISGELKVNAAEGGQNLLQGHLYVQHENFSTAVAANDTILLLTIINR